MRHICGTVRHICGICAPVGRPGGARASWGEVGGRGRGSGGSGGSGSYLGSGVLETGCLEELEALLMDATLLGEPEEEALCDALGLG